MCENYGEKAPPIFCFLLADDDDSEFAESFSLRCVIVTIADEIRARSLSHAAELNAMMSSLHPSKIWIASTITVMHQSLMSRCFRTEISSAITCLHAWDDFWSAVILQPILEIDNTTSHLSVSLPTHAKEMARAERGLKTS